MKAIQQTALALVLAAGLCSCAESAQKDNVTNDKDTMVLKSDDQPAGTPKAEDAWAAVDWNSPALKYDEVKSSDVTLRGNEQYGIYGLGENILFETGKADLKAGAENNLKRVAASINQRYANGKVKIYGYTDDKGSDGANLGLSRKRAEAVMAWLTANGGIAADRVSLYAEGEARPVASNDNAAGREQNRRVEVVAMK